jgi:hypothetical protein
MSNTGDSSSRSSHNGLGAFAFSLVVGVCAGLVINRWCASTPPPEPDEQYRVPDGAVPYGHRVTWYYERPSILSPTGHLTQKTRDWPAMSRAWHGERARPYLLPLTQEGYEKCKAPEWSAAQRDPLRAPIGVVVSNARL